MRIAWTMLLAAPLAAACGGDGSGLGTADTVVTEYVTVRRAWNPGERDSLIARIIANRTWTFPYVGDISDQAPLILDPDSAVVLVRNPALPAPPPGPSGAPGALRVPGAGWTTAGVDSRIIDNSQSPPDTTDYLGFLWSNDADDTWKGFVFAAAPGTTVAATVVNTTPFDAGGHNSGAGGGEFRLAAPTTYWEARGWVRRNTVSVTANFAFGGATTVTTGPFLGGTQQTAFMSGQLDSVRLDRITGTFGTNPQYASASFTFVGSIRLVCVFPTPCTTNALRAAAAAREARMTPALRAELPWGRR